jgi:Tfp pilus assembly protein PilV
MANRAEKLLKDRAGTTLIELVAALFVITIGLFGVIEMYHFGINKIHALNEYKIAMRAVQNEIETLRALPFSELRNTDDGEFRSDTPEVATLVNATPAVTITDYAEGEKQLKHVEVSVKWTGEHGRTIEKRVTTLIADKGQI